MVITALSTKTGHSHFLLLYEWSPRLSTALSDFVQNKEDNTHASYANSWNEQLKRAYKIAMMNSYYMESLLQEESSKQCFVPRKQLRYKNLSRHGQMGNMLEGYILYCRRGKRKGSCI